MEYSPHFLRVGKATDLSGRDFKIYRILEILPGALSIGTLIVLLLLSYFQPVFVAYFIIAFSVYWLLLVIYMAIFLIASYRRLKTGLKTDWRARCENLATGNYEAEEASSACLARQGWSWQDVWHLVVLPTYNENIDIIRASLTAIAQDGFPAEKMIVALAIEERAGPSGHEKAAIIQQEFADKFGRFMIVFHPDGIEGELKGKGANQGWCVKQVKTDLIDKEGFDYHKILISVGSGLLNLRRSNSEPIIFSSNSIL